MVEPAAEVAVASVAAAAATVVVGWARVAVAAMA